MFWSTFSRDCAISDTSASRAVWKGVGGGGGGRVEAISSVLGERKNLKAGDLIRKKSLLVVNSMSHVTLSNPEDLYLYLYIQCNTRPD